MKADNQINLLELTDKKKFIRQEGATHKISIHRIKNNSLDTHSLYNNGFIQSLGDFEVTSNYKIITTYLSVPEVHFYIGIYDNEVIGTFDFVISADNQIEIKNFGVGNNRKHQDIADQWLSRAIEYTFQLNPKRIFLYVPKSSGMKRLFKKCGFSFKKPGQSGKLMPSGKSNFGIISNFQINYN
ncbi:GNAT family N-acetyltransferase [Carboxylicivirga linearis]|uniref:GNAT family N-acetyltransferase n=1 Tax=Carboxylicivirga linearis TaxID=1628157 RepID=A0ABS5JQ20_9BACT|nr:GNAT family N-acetyltransferase [Carboxylicivirga linearis]MBS2096945.1 GNAT family N-acetyltransferase [Carboxylicivirga linearis]